MRVADAVAITIAIGLCAVGVYVVTTMKSPLHKAGDEITRPAPAKPQLPPQIVSEPVGTLPPSILRGLDNKDKKPMTAEGRRDALKKHTEATFGEAFELLGRLTDGRFRVAYEMSDNPSGSTISITTNLRSNRGLLYVINARLGDTPDQVSYSLNTQIVQSPPLKDPDKIIQFLTEVIDSKNWFDPQRKNEIEAVRTTGPASGNAARP